MKERSDDMETLATVICLGVPLGIMVYLFKWCIDEITYLNEIDEEEDDDEEF